MLFKVEDCLDTPLTTVSNIIKYKITYVADTISTYDTYDTYGKIMYTRIKRFQNLASKDIITLLKKIGKAYNYLLIDTDYGFEIAPYSRWLELLICELDILEKSCNRFDQLNGVITHCERVMNKTDRNGILKIRMSKEYSDGLWHSTVVTRSGGVVEYNGLKSDWVGIILMKDAVLQLLQYIDRKWCVSLPADFEFVIKRDQPWLNILLDTIKEYDLPVEKTPIEKVPIEKVPIETPVEESPIKTYIENSSAKKNIPPKPYYTRANGKTHIDMPPNAAAVEIIPSGYITVVRVQLNNVDSFTLSSNNLEIIKNIQDVNNPHATIRFGYDNYEQVRLYSDEPFYYHILDKENLPSDLKCYRQISCGNFTITKPVEYYYTEVSKSYGGDLLTELKKHKIWIFKKTMHEKNAAIFDPNNHGVIEI